jgi:hypothetical protein
MHSALVTVLCHADRIDLRLPVSAKSNANVRIAPYAMLFEGIVNLPRARRHDGGFDEWSESSRRILGEFGEFTPCNEPGCELFSIK